MRVRRISESKVGIAVLKWQRSVHEKEKEAGFSASLPIKNTAAAFHITPDASNGYSFVNLSVFK